MAEPGLRAPIRLIESQKRHFSILRTQLPKIPKMASPGILGAYGGAKSPGLDPGSQEARKC